MSASLAGFFRYVFAAIGISATLFWWRVLLTAGIGMLVALMLCGMALALS